MPAPPRLTDSAGFLTVAARSEAGNVAVEGVAALPGLPVRRLRLRADAERLFLYGPDVATLVRYVAAELRADIGDELPQN